MDEPADLKKRTMAEMMAKDQGWSIHRRIHLQLRYPGHGLRGSCKVQEADQGEEAEERLRRSQ